MKQNLLRLLPKVDEVLAEERISALMERIPRNTMVDTVRDVIDRRRQQILEGLLKDEKDLGLDTLADEIVREAEAASYDSLRPVVNATGVVLHTNLGRASLSDKACAVVAEIVGRYSTLEYDPDEGARGSRHTHTEELLKKITGAEAAMVVNNNAAATFLTLASIGSGKEMIVSRGELVEIGGFFRIPDIMEQSGVKLIEVGTTNKTKPGDYESHITDETAALLKVHTSNYAIVGFTEDTSVEDLRALGDKYGLPVIYDMGSGLLADLKPWGIREPVVKEGLEAGADIVLFSGDKLLGGPQAGIICGRKEFIDKMKRHPLARVLRVDKMTISALEATLREYLDMDKAMTDIPVPRMITRDAEDLRAEAAALKQLTDEITDPATGGPAYRTAVAEDCGMIGGGSAPMVKLRSFVLTLASDKHSPDALESLLRSGRTPVVTRIKDDKVTIDVRTLAKGDSDIIIKKLREIAENGESLS